MSNVVELRGSENGETLSALCPPSEPSFRAALIGAARLWWHRARLSVEAVGWIVLAASIIAAIKG